MQELICPRSHLLEELRVQIIHSMPLDTRKDLLQAVEALEQEGRKTSPTPLLINALCTYLAQHEPLSASANALMALYQEK